MENSHSFLSNSFACNSYLFSVVEDKLGIQISVKLFSYNHQSDGTCNLYSIFYICFLYYMISRL